MWGSTYKSHLNCILYTQKMAIRTITFSHFMSRSAPLFYELKILDINKFYELSLCTFMYDLVHNNLPHCLTDYCDKIEHRYNTRKREKGHLRIPLYKTTQGKFSVTCVGTRLWNELPDEIKNKGSRNTFRKHLNDYLMNKWLNYASTHVYIVNNLHITFLLFFFCQKNAIFCINNL